MKNFGQLVHSIQEPDELSKSRVCEPKLSDSIGTHEAKNVEDQDDIYLINKAGVTAKNTIEAESNGNHSTATQGDVTKQENEKLQKLLQELSATDKRKIETFIKQGRPDKVTQQIAGLGLSMTSQEGLIKHFTQYLEDGIKRISWTGKRLAYAVAILENTLDSAGNNNITSIENLIQNYLIFCKTFKEYEDNKIPRYGQFSYVMRAIFFGITEKSQIEERIKQHKTFGQKADLTQDELDALHAEVKKATDEVRNDFLEAKKKKRGMDKVLTEASQEEKQEKGRVWNGKFAPPKEYTFPNYTFQTGEKKGKNTSVGRSSWEPLFEAYADTVNKKMEGRISAKTGLSEEEKQRRIREQRIELLYEKFEFPVGIRTNQNGEQIPIVYILDFIDINRWRGIEVKGPLTLKAAEKIRFFQKYYVDGDFSGLPEDEKIIMMSYVQGKLDEIKDWCIDNDYPVFEQFLSLEILGMYKWDHDLNNFNRYEEVRHMKELSVRQRQQLQKGFIKLVEDRIASGKTPDIRPEHYVPSDKLSTVIKMNKKEAGKEKAPYVVQENVSTRPYFPELFAKEIAALEKSPEIEGYKVIEKVIETLPVPQDFKEVILSVHKCQILWKAIFDLSQVDIFKTGDIGITKTPLRDIAEFALSNPAKPVVLFLQKYISANDGKNLDNDNYRQELLAEFQRIKDIFSRVFTGDNKFHFDHHFMRELKGLNYFNVNTTFCFFMLPSSVKDLFFKRSDEVNMLIENKKNEKLFSELKLENIVESKDWQNDKLYMTANFLLISKKVKPKSLQIIYIAELFDVLNELTAKTLDKHTIALGAHYPFEYIIKKKFISNNHAAKYFSDNDYGAYSEEMYLRALECHGMNNSNVDEIKTAAKILLVEELGQETFDTINNELLAICGEYGIKKSK